MFWPGMYGVYGATHPWMFPGYGMCGGLWDVGMAMGGPFWGYNPWGAMFGGYAGGAIGTGIGGLLGMAAGSLAGPWGALTGSAVGGLLGGAVGWAAGSLLGAHSFWW